MMFAGCFDNKAQKEDKLLKDGGKNSWLTLSRRSKKFAFTAKE
jgi:hypothetical protein